MQDLAVFERGWLSSNNILVHAARGEPGALLVDSGHLNHAPQTLALVAHALAGRPLAALVNTHLHSDHCGGNAALQRAHGVPLAIPPGQAGAVQTWDDELLSYRITGQRIERFSAQRLLQPGEPLVAGGREWEVIAAPGHDPHAVMLFDRANRLLLSADALWRNGFGLVFPEIEGGEGFDDVGAVLDRIAALPVRVVVPGHGAPFDDVAEALDRARSRLRSWRDDPARHAHHAVKVLLKYHLMEERAQARAQLLDWAVATPLLAGVWQRYPPRGLARPEDWIGRVVDELLAAGALRLHDGVVHDA